MSSSFRSLIFCLLLTLGIGTQSIPYSFALDDSLQSDSEQQQPDGEIIPEQDQNKANSKPKLKGYAEWREDFSAFCNYLIKDQQAQIFVDILNKYRQSRGDCSACRQLYRNLNCKGLAKKGQIAQTARSSLPSTEIVAVTSKIFMEISKDKILADATADALKPVLEDLAAISSISSKAYFEILVEYMTAPLKLSFAELGKRAEEKHRKDRKKLLEDLF